MSAGYLTVETGAPSRQALDAHAMCVQAALDKQLPGLGVAVAAVYEPEQSSEPSLSAERRKCVEQRSRMRRCGDRSTGEGDAVVVASVAGRCWSEEEREAMQRGLDELPENHSGARPDYFDGWFAARVFYRPDTPSDGEVERLREQSDRERRMYQEEITHRHQREQVLRDALEALVHAKKLKDEMSDGRVAPHLGPPPETLARLKTEAWKLARVALATSPDAIQTGAQ